jgi:putative nucleotidyltransferase with HDIG domain
VNFGTHLAPGAAFEEVTAGIDQDASIRLETISWLRDIAGLPVLVKGVLRADDAVACIDAGAAGVVVSNHGGRQLDRAIAPAVALPEIVDALEGRAPILVDGGIVSGTDVFVALALADEALRLRFLAPMLERFTMVLANALESKDYQTQEHSARLVGMSDAIARHLRLDDGARSVIRFGACLHDIGKVAVPEALLRKPGALTPEESAILRTHPEVGAGILADIDTWEDVRLIVRHHHEHFDGAGYPDGLRGDRIPLGARIVSVVDAYDVMRTGRPYQPARSIDWILAELRRERGRQFDPELVSALIAVLPTDGTTLEQPPLDLDLLPDRRSAVGRRQNDVAVASWLRGGAGAMVRVPIVRN